MWTQEREDVTGIWRTYTVESSWICTLSSHNVRNYLNLTHNKNNKTGKVTQIKRCKAVAVHALKYRSEIWTKEKGSKN
jgi:hypothetical protein